MYSSRKERTAHIGRSFAIPLFIAAVFLTGCEKGIAVPPLDDEITIQAFFLPDYDQTEDLSEFTSLPVFRINDGSIEYSEQRASLLAEYFSIDLSGMSRGEQYSGDIGDYIYTDVFTTDSVRYEEHFDHSIVNLCADPFGTHFGVYDNKYDNADPMGVFGFEHIDGSYFSYDEENDAAILPPERLSEFEMLSEKYIAGNKEWFGDGYSLYCSRTGASTGIHPEIHNSLLIVGKLKNDPSKRVMSHAKSSLAQNGQSLVFQVNEHSELEWCGTIELTADQFLEDGGTSVSKLESAKQFLLAILADGAKSQKEIQAAAEEMEFGIRTLKSAKARLTLCHARLSQSCLGLIGRQITD